MDIISISFVLFVLVAVFIYYLLNKKHRVLFVSILSCGFVASFSYLLLGYIILFTLVNYLIGKKLSEIKNKKLLFRIGVVFNVSQLVLLKYASFVIDPFFSLFGSQIEVSILSKIIIPIGISYFTLQGIGYLINIKMGWEKHEQNFIDFLLYIAFFPKFLSGPIERSNHFLPQIKKDLAFDRKVVSGGLRIALFGFFKKVAIANQLSPFITGAYGDIGATDGAMLWAVILVQPLYLYFDFSGYTDIAIGFARMFGINLLPNFNRPFFSENVSLFWRKFHMSLSLWFSDYIFKQTMFIRRKWGDWAPIYALLLTWTLFGIWHGAGWNFMVLGVLQAIAIIYEFFTKRWRMKTFSRINKKLNVFSSRMITYLFYAFSLVFFFSPDLPMSLTFFSRLTECNGFSITTNQQAVLLATFGFISIFMVLEYIQNDYEPYFKRIESWWNKQLIPNKVFRWGVYYCVMIVVIVLSNETQNFIYFQF